MKFQSIFLTILSIAGTTTAFAPSSLLTNQVTSSQQYRSSSSLSMAAESSNPFSNFLGGLFSKSEVSVEPEKPKIPDFVVDSDYTLSYVFGALGLFIIATSPDKACLPGSFLCAPSVWGVVQGGLNILFATFLAIQATRVRFVFDEDSFELKTVSLKGEDNLQDSGENFVVGGANRWTYDSFVNWDFFPSEKFPILVYFKETQTPEDQWGAGPGEFDKVGGGQIHFFPAIAKVPQLKEQFELRGCVKVVEDE